MHSRYVIYVLQPPAWGRWIRNNMDVLHSATHNMLFIFFWNAIRCIICLTKCVHCGILKLRMGKVVIENDKQDSYSPHLSRHSCYYSYRINSVYATRLTNDGISQDLLTYLAAC